MAKQTYELIIEKVYRARKTIVVDVEKEMKDNPDYAQYFEDMVVSECADKSGLLDDCEGYDLEETNIRTIENKTTGVTIFED